MKLLLLFIFSLSVLKLPAQQPNFILLKHKERTVATYFAGTTIKFTTVNNVNVEAKITDVRNDTLFLKAYVIRQAPTQLGIYILDTNYYYSQYHYKEIKAIDKRGRRFDWGASGATLMGGGILLSVASGVIYLADRNKYSPGLMAASAGLFGVGYLLSKKSGKGMVIGKKYSLVYVSAGPNQKN